MSLKKFAHFRPGSGRSHSGVNPLLPAHPLPLSFRSQRGTLFASRTISREIPPSPLFLSLSFRAQRGIPQPPFNLAFLIAFAAVHSPTRNGEPSIAKNVFRLHPRREVGVLYTGITNHLPRRVSEHKEKRMPAFTQKYSVTKL